jgi:hypothetical protein
MNLNQELVKQRLVLAVSALCAGGYSAGRTKEGSTRGAERVVGRPATGAPVGVAEGMSPHPLRCSVDYVCASPGNLNKPFGGESATVDALTGRRNGADDGNTNETDALSSV